MKRWVFVLLCLLTAHPVVAATYYVSKSGNDGNSCATAQSTTQSNQKLTVNGGRACLAAGDTLLIHAGTYVEALIQPPIAGTSWSNFIRIAAVAGETVWLKPPAGGGLNWILDLQSGQRYIEFDGINLDTTNATPGNAIGGIAISGADNSHHIRFKNGEILGNRIAGDLLTSRVGIVLNGQAGFNEIGPNVTIHGSGGPNSYYGMYIHSQDNVVDGADIYDVGYEGIQVYNSGGWTPDRNTIKNSKIHDIVQGFDTRRGGILFMGDNNLVYNNLIYGINSTSTGVDTIALVVYGGVNNQVLNNTIANNHSLSMYVAGLNTLIANNIAYGNDTDTPDNHGTGTTQTTNLYTDPGFVNAAGNNFHLASTGSAAYNTGTTYAAVPSDHDGNARPQAGAFDKGAYEYIVSAVGPPATTPLTGPTKIQDRLRIRP